MLKINIICNDAENQLDANMDVDSATLAELTISERMLRRYLDQIVNISNERLDKDTRNSKEEKEKKTIVFNPKIDSSKIGLSNKGIKVTSNKEEIMDIFQTEEEQ